MSGPPGSVYNIKTLTRFTNDALSHPIEIEQKPDADVPSEADGTGRRLWPTALVLSRYLCAHPHLVAGKRVIELGAGPGCSGLVCAALGASHVVLTDMPEALPLCRDNLARNPRLASRVSVAPCAWGDGPSIAALLAGSGGFDVVIACEVVYKQDPEILQALAATQAALARTGATILMAYEFRGDLFDDMAYFDAVNEIFDCETTPLRPYEEEQAYEDDDEGGCRFLYSYFPYPTPSLLDGTKAAARPAEGAAGAKEAAKEAAEEAVEERAGAEAEERAEAEAEAARLVERGFEPDEVLAVDLPVFSDCDSDSDSDSGGGGGTGAADRADTGGAEGSALPSGVAGARVGEVLQLLADGGTRGVSPLLFDLAFWRAEAAAEGLHVLEEGADAARRRRDDAAPADVALAQALRSSLDRRGYLQAPPLAAADPAALAALRRMLVRLRARGFAPAFIYMFDEAWALLEAAWALLAEVLAPGAGPAALVLEPSFYAHALARPADAAAARGGGTELRRFSYLGGNFGTPHRDHASSDCFDPAGNPTMLSLWCPLTSVTADNGCMFVLPKEHDELLHAPTHPKHLLPFDQHSGTCNFPLGGAVALAPCAPGAALAWHGSSVHWGGACSSHAEAEPRASLTAVLRLRSAPRTQLQSAQELPELEASALPLSLGARVRYVASALLVYSYWYSLSHGVLPPDMLEDE